MTSSPSVHCSVRRRAASLSFWSLWAALLVVTACDGEAHPPDADRSDGAIDASDANDAGRVDDLEAPVISLLGEDRLILSVGHPYVEPSATAVDNIDGDISDQIVIDASALDTMVLGTYPVTYNVRDASGNAAAQVERSVVVDDLAGPFTQTFLILYRNFSGEATAEELARYDVLDVNRSSYDDLGPNTWSDLRAINPDIEIYLYQLGSQSISTQDTWPIVSCNSLCRWDDARGHSMGSLNGDNAHLFATFEGGRLESPSFPNNWLHLFGHSEYQDYWVEATLHDLHDQPWSADGVFVDNATSAGVEDRNPLGGSTPLPDAYPTGTAWNEAMNEFNNAITAGSHAQGLRVWTNRGNSREALGTEAWLALDGMPTPPDFLLEEGAWAVRYGAGDTQFFDEASWRRQVDIIGQIENSNVAMLAHSDLTPDGDAGTDNYARPVTFHQTLWYALASYHLGRNDILDNIYFSMQLSSFQTYVWYDEYERLALGAAVAPYQMMEIEGTNIYWREFEAGYVFVNPTNIDVSDIPLPTAARELSHATINDDFRALPRTTSFSLMGHHGTFFLK